MEVGEGVGKEGERKKRYKDWKGGNKRVVFFDGLGILILKLRGKEYGKVIGYNVNK